MRKLILSAVIGSAMLFGGMAVANAQCFDASQCFGELLGGMIAGMQHRTYYRPMPRPHCPWGTRLVRDRYGRLVCLMERRPPVRMWGYHIAPRYVGRPVTLGHPVTLGYPVQ